MVHGASAALVVPAARATEKVGSSDAKDDRRGRLGAKFVILCSEMLQALGADGDRLDG